MVRSKNFLLSTTITAASAVCCATGFAVPPPTSSSGPSSSSTSMSTSSSLPSLATSPLHLQQQQQQQYLFEDVAVVGDTEDSLSSPSSFRIRRSSSLMNILDVTTDDDFIIVRKSSTTVSSSSSVSSPTNGNNNNNNNNKNDDDDKNDKAGRKVRTSKNDVTTSTTTTTSTTDLPPVLQQITDERRNFQMNLGKAMDTLRKDYPYILQSTPDYSIYHPDITVVDPSGVQLTGLDSYKSSIKFMQQFIQFWFHTSNKKGAGLQFRLVYDFARSSIRVSWHTVLLPKVPVLGLGRPIHLDGVCMYKLDVESGKIIEHKFEKLVINNTPVVPPYGVFSLLQQQQDLMGVTPGVGVPAGI